MYCTYVRQVKGKMATCSASGDVTVYGQLSVYDLCCMNEDFIKVSANTQPSKWQKTVDV